MELLTRQEECGLGTKIQQGDLEARDSLILCNIRLVHKIARKYFGKGLPPDDVVQEGFVGLIHAAEIYDPSRGTKFSTSATPWIHQAIQRAIRKQVRVIKIPPYLIDLIAKWRRAKRQLTEENKCNPTPKQIQELLGLSNKKTALIQQALKHNVTALGEREIVDDDRFLPLIEDEEVEHYLEQLDPLEHQIIDLYYGRHDQETQTLARISQICRISVSTVSIIHDKAIEKLQKLTHSNV